MRMFSHFLEMPGRWVLICFLTRWVHVRIPWEDGCEQRNYLTLGHHGAPGLASVPFCLLLFSS